MNYWSLNPAQTLRAELSSWEAQAAVGRRPRTVEYNGRLIAKIRDTWPVESIDAKCQDITVETVCRFIKRHEHRCASHFNHVVNVVRALVPAARFLRRRRESPKVVALPSEDEFNRLLEDLDTRSQSKRGGLTVRLLVLTGLRIIEARGLTRDQVLEDGLHVPAAVSKNGRDRVIPYLPGCREVVQGLIRIAPRHGKSLIAAQSIRKALEGSCKRVGIRKLSHHDFRRMFATRCIQAGVDLPTAAAWMGHSDGGTLLGKTYFQIMSAHSKEMADRVKIAV